jgi:hypothetical protein
LVLVVLTEEKGRAPIDVVSWQPRHRERATLGETRGNKHRLRFHASKLTDVAEMELQLVAVE